jgi:hypothetical protein
MLASLLFFNKSFKYCWIATPILSAHNDRKSVKNMQSKINTPQVSSKKLNPTPTLS